VEKEGVNKIDTVYKCSLFFFSFSFSATLHFSFLLSMKSLVVLSSQKSQSSQPEEPPTEYLHWQDENSQAEDLHHQDENSQAEGFLQQAKEGFQAKPKDWTVLPNGDRRCKYPPCLFTGTYGAVRTHQTRLHNRDAEVVAGSFKAVAVPTFHLSLAKLQCALCGDYFSNEHLFRKTHIFKMECSWCKLFRRCITKQGLVISSR